MAPPHTSIRPVRSGGGGAQSTLEVTMQDLAIIAGSGHDHLAADVARIVGVPCVPVEHERLPDGELGVRLLEPVFGRCAVIIQPTGPPVDEHLVELLALADACRRAATERVVAVVPCFGYARGDRRSGSGGPIMAGLAPGLIQAAGVDQLVTVDLHAPQIEGFFQIPVDDLAAIPLVLSEMREGLPADLVVVSPDLGRLELATAVADQLGSTTAVVHKRRISGRQSRTLQVVGEVAGRACLIVDDMISTGGTIAGAVEALLKAGAQPRITVAATHGLFLPGAGELLARSEIDRIWVTDTLPQRAGAAPRRSVVTIAPLLAGALERLRTAG
jgi:ribose-phosphate pyrophosphokinase